MLLTSVQTIREEIGFDDMKDINAAITMALNAAETLIASTLRTTFERKTVTDRFWVPEPSFVQGAHRRTEFLLSAGFIADTPAITGGPANMLLDKEKGIARDFSTFYVQQIVEFTYTCGFEKSDEQNGEEADTYKDVPAWLQQAAKLKTLLLVAKLPAVTEAGISLETNLLDQQYASLINSHIRYAPAAILPI
ncbi:hypothetical protein [Hyphomicrobium sp.]|uniref:hypothetical protein n=1 Tax=Hyphomicrobium sp. TaxID=82 RepID=UPI001DB3DF14|nr:hypothetical protein [Hyphomicrobium sp.]MBY0560002.1 hypothetical protein [Hyphomicrobium sp.]